MGEAPSVGSSASWNILETWTPERSLLLKFGFALSIHVFCFILVKMGKSWTLCLSLSGSSSRPVSPLVIFWELPIFETKNQLKSELLSQSWHFLVFSQVGEQQSGERDWQSILFLIPASGKGPKQCSHLGRTMECLQVTSAVAVPSSAGMLFCFCLISFPQVFFFSSSLNA